MAGKQAFSAFWFVGRNGGKNVWGVYCDFGICLFECSDVFARRANVSICERFKPSAEIVCGFAEEYVDFKVRMFSRSSDRIRAIISKNNSAYSEVIEA